MVIAPRSCERAVFGLMMRPAAKTPSNRGTRTSPVVTLTRTSANCAPKACMENCCASGFVSKAPVASSPPAGTLPPYSSRSRARSALAALQIAHPHEAVPDEPPAQSAFGRELSPISRCTRSSGTSSASAAICMSAVQAPVPMSVASMRTW